MTLTEKLRNRLNTFKEETGKPWERIHQEIGDDLTYHTIWKFAKKDQRPNGFTIDTIDSYLRENGY